MRALRKLTEGAHGELRFRSVPPLLVPLRDLFNKAHPQNETEYVQELMARYADSLDEDRRYLFGTYRFVDMARKVVGVGSVGTRATVFLLVGRDGKDPLVLQAKEAPASVLEPYRARANSITTANGWSGASGSRTRRATSSSVGRGVWISTAESATSTSANSGTGRRPWTFQR